MDYEVVLEEFKKYISQFDTKCPSILMKVNHSYYVADLGSKLAKRLELSKTEQILAKVLGLIHDLGRFTQYEKTKTYSDVKSNLNHASLAIDYLFKDGHIKDFKIPEEYHEIIKKAILNHNKLAIESNLNEKELFWVQFLRDIDKIDIFRQDAAGLSLNYEELITKNVKKAFYNHSLVKNEDINLNSDAIVASLAFVFDINFLESYELLSESDNLELFLSVINVENNECETEFELIKKEVRKYLAEKINN